MELKSSNKVTMNLVRKRQTPDLTGDLGVAGVLINKKQSFFNAWNCTRVVLQKTEGDGKKQLQRGNHLLWQHISISAVCNTSLKLPKLCRVLYAEHSFLLLSLCDCWNPIFRGVWGQHVVFLNVQTSQSIVDAPWTKMMCKIAFLEACGLWEGLREADTSQVALADCLNEKSPSIQPRSQAHWILFSPGSCSDYWAGMKHTRTPALKRNPQSSKQSSSISKESCVMIKGSLMSLVLGNWTGFGDSLVKTSFVLSAAALSL